MRSNDSAPETREGTMGKLQEKNFEKQRAFLVDLYKVLEVGKEVRTSMAQISDATGYEPNIVSYVLNVLRHKNGYAIRTEYGAYGSASGLGKRSYWTLLIPYDRAERYLREWQDNNRSSTHRSRSSARKTVIERKKSEVAKQPVAMSFGDDAPRSIDIQRFSPANKEPGALVAAAKQYSEKFPVVQKALDTLKSGGLTIDEEAFFKAMNLQKDDRLETIALILPYIDQMERTITRLTEANKQLRKNGTQEPQTQQKLPWEPLSESVPGKA
jgi:hypothetical protein